jgi:hypothetical protein
MSERNQAFEEAALLADRRADVAASFPDWEKNEWAVAHHAEARLIARLIRNLKYRSTLTPAEMDTIMLKARKTVQPILDREARPASGTDGPKF